MEGLTEAAERLVGQFQEFKEAALLDVHEARSLTRYLQYSGQNVIWVMERCLFTFLFILRAGVEAEDGFRKFPASEDLRNFSTSCFQGDPFPGVDDDECAWEPLEQLWRHFNKDKVCSRLSAWYWSMPLKRARKPWPDPQTPSLLGSCGSVPDDELPCGWECGGGCLPPHITAECVAQRRGRITNEDARTNCSCAGVIPGRGDADCLNIFDVVDRLVRFNDELLALPLRNLGWNLRQAVRTDEQQRAIDNEYSKATALRPHLGFCETDYELRPLRVGEVRRLIQGIQRSPVLRQLLLSRTPNSTLPVYHSLADAPLHARLWLVRSNLPLRLEDSTFTYADICTVREAAEVELLRKERGHSIVEYIARMTTVYLLWGARSLNGERGVRVKCLRPEDYDIPEEVLQVNKNLWKALLQIPHPMVVAEGSYDRKVSGIADYSHLLTLETRAKKSWLLRDGEPESYSSVAALVALNAVALKATASAEAPKAAAGDSEGAGQDVKVPDKSEEGGGAGAFDLKELEKTALVEFMGKVEAAINSLEFVLDSEGEAAKDVELELWGVPLLPSKGDPRTEVVLLKFLRARELKVKDALLMLKDCMLWRKSYGVARILNEDLGSNYDALAFNQGVDKQGHPVQYNVELYSDKVTENWEAALRWRVQLLEKQIQSLSFQPGGVSSMLLVVDLKNAAKVQNKQARQFVSQALKLFADNYPEVVDKIVLLNVPSHLNAILRLFSVFITKRIRSKFITSSSLFEFIEAENIPVQYGGLSRPYDADFGGGSGQVMGLEVEAGQTKPVEIGDFGTGDAVVYEFAQIGSKVTLTYWVEFVPSREAGSRVIVEHPKKMSLPNRNSFKSPEPGKLVISVANSNRTKVAARYRYIKKQPVNYESNGTGRRDGTGPVPSSMGQGAQDALSILSLASPHQRRWLLGELLFPLVQNHQYELARKITGMLLELDNAQILVLLKTPNALAMKVEEAVRVLQQPSKQQLGQLLFPRVHALEKALAGKITGMLLELKNSEILVLLEEPATLARKVGEAVQVLVQAHGSKSKMLLGQRLFPVVQTHQVWLAGKITEMLLGMDNAEIQALLKTPTALAMKVEATGVRALQQHIQSCETNTPKIRKVKDVMV